MEDEWKTNLNLDEIDNSSFSEFHKNFISVYENILTLLENTLKSGRLNKITSAAQSYDEELKYLIDKNKALKQEIDSLTDQVSKKQLNYEERKKDVKLFEKEIKDRHEAFLMAKKCYKKLLKTYFTIESKDTLTETIYIQFFTEARKESENYSVRFIKDLMSGQYKILSTTPNLEELNEIKRVLQETNDVPGAICSIRHAFKTLKLSKKHNGL